MLNLKDVYSGSKFDERWNASRSIKRDSFPSMERYSLDSADPEYKFLSEANHSIQEENFGIIPRIRGIFGKTGQISSTIGGHPHFDHLSATKSQENGYAVSLFLDIKGSTKLGVIYSPAEVFFIKNTIIKCAIETIQAFDGHVHRIMGDAVLAFFRVNDQSPRDSAINAINCGTYVVEFMKQLVIPALEQGSIYSDIGIRVGIDYGDDSKVLWGMYGYSNASEVTATSFHVDVAAKLQQSAPRNRVMIGQSLKELLDLHEGVIENRYYTKEDKSKLDRFITPNYTDLDKKPINYEKYVITHKKYLELLPSVGETKQISISSTLCSSENAISQDDYICCSRAIRKPNGIKFKAKFVLPPDINNHKLTVRFRVENHGADARSQPNNDDHETFIPATKVTGTEEYFAKRWERTSHTGLHYMHVSVFRDGGLIIPEQKFAIYVGD